MSKQMNPEELCAHTEKAITELHQTLGEFRESPVSKLKKRAMLLAYWIKTYAYYLRHEDSFVPLSVFRLKRGSVVSVEFGYRVGRELGGRHYAVVLDVDNPVHSNTVTVLPLGSKKEHMDKNPYYVILDDGIFAPMEAKLRALIADAKKTIDEIGEVDIKMRNSVPDETMALKAVRRSKLECARQTLADADRHYDEIMHLRPGSVANIRQITTISKMRIAHPLQKTHPLYGIRLTAADLDRIDAALLKRYFPSVENSSCENSAHNC